MPINHALASNRHRNLQFRSQSISNNSSLCRYFEFKQVFWLKLRVMLRLPSFPVALCNTLSSYSGETAQDSNLFPYDPDTIVISGT